MEEIRAFACDELLQLSNGGEEVGGVVFGTRREDLVRIITWRPIACEHAQGAGLRLSYNDRMNLAVQLEMARQNPDLKDLRPLGWFVSHLREGVSLSPSDLEIYNGFFPEAWQVALVICPKGSGRAQAGFFVREAEDKVQSAASYQCFDLQPLHLPPIVTTPIVSIPIITKPEARNTDAPEPEAGLLEHGQTPPTPPIESLVQAIEAEQATVQEATQPAPLPVDPIAFVEPRNAVPPPMDPSHFVEPRNVAPPPADPSHFVEPRNFVPPPMDPSHFVEPRNFAPPSDLMRRFQPRHPAPPIEEMPLATPSFQVEEAVPTHERWLWAIPIVLALGIAAFMLYQRRAPSPNASIALHALSEAQTVQLTWDANSRTIRDSDRGEIDVNDSGKNSQVSLSGDQLHAGKMSYRPQSGDVGFTMTVYPASGEPIHDYTRLIEPAFNSPTQPPQVVPPNPAPATPPSANPSSANPPPASPVPPPAEQSALQERSALQQEVQQLKDDLSKERARANELQNVVRILENRLGIRSTAPKTQRRR